VKFISRLKAPAIQPILVPVARNMWVAGLVAQIAGASREQTEGVTQISQAVAQMDKMTQTNAGQATEGAAAAEDLSAQATALKEAVTELLLFVGQGGRPPNPAADPGPAPATTEMLEQTEETVPPAASTPSRSRATELGSIRPIPSNGSATHTRDF
jgi:methyl-accepting chemotaxis protein